MSCKGNSKADEYSNTKESFSFNPNASDFMPGKTWQSLVDSSEENVECQEKLDSLTLGGSPEQLSDRGSPRKLPSGGKPTSEVKVSLDVPIAKKKGSTNDSTAPPPDPRQHLNIVFIGHIDAGKSTTCGNILYLSGYVDERTIEKYEKEAKDRNRESWFLAFIMDTNEEERQKGKTVEVGQARIETPNRRLTILDAPGHRNYVPNMISGASQADCGVLILSARKGEFETGFERGGQTREHALLAKTLGVNHMIVAVNKMDDATCQWSEERYRSIVKKLKPFLKTCGFLEGKNLNFVPISGLIGQNIIQHVSDVNYKHHDPNAAWYDISQPTLFQLLDVIPPVTSDENAPLRIPLTGGYRENGMICLGKVESGIVRAGQSCVIMPNKIKTKISNVYFDEDDYAYAKTGENIKLRILGIEEDQVSKGSVICSVESPCPVVSEFVALISVIDLLEHRPLITSGYYCVMHAHSVVVEVKFVKLIEATDKMTKKKKLSPTFVRSNTIVSAHLKLTIPACLETFDNCAQMGRFTLRDEDKTISVGKILEILGSE